MDYQMTPELQKLLESLIKMNKGYIEALHSGRPLTPALENAKKFLILDTADMICTELQSQETAELVKNAKL